MAQLGKHSLLAAAKPALKRTPFFDGPSTTQAEVQAEVIRLETKFTVLLYSSHASYLLSASVSCPVLAH
jgi:hypothetical protein